MKPPRHVSAWTFLIALLLAITPALAEPPRPQGDAQFWSNYTQGLMCLREGRFQDAIQPLTVAIQRNPDPRAYLARARIGSSLQSSMNGGNPSMMHSRKGTYGAPLIRSRKL
jgi:hypothetical protein